MAEKDEVYTFTIDLNLQPLFDKFREAVTEKVENHNRWHKETLDNIRRKVRNPSLFSDIVVKTPRQRKRKTVLSTAKKPVDINGTRKKQRRTIRPSAVVEDSTSSSDSKENGGGERQVKRGLFDDNDMEATISTESKWKTKQYTRASRAVLRETISKEKNETSESEQQVPETRRTTRALRKTECQLKTEEVRKEANDTLIAEQDKVITNVADCAEINTEIQEQSENIIEEATAVPTDEDNKHVEEEDTVMNSPEKFETPMARKESENEWLTDDESFHEAHSSPVESKTSIPEKKSPVETKKIVPGRKKSLSHRNSQKLLRTQIPTTSRVTRAQARIQATTDKIVTRSMQKKIASSGGSDSDTGSSAKSVRCVSRIHGSAVKSLTASALKKREEDMQRKRLLLQKSAEKQSKVLENKEKILKQKITEHRMKREEKQKRFQHALEQQEKEKEEKRLQELKRKEEAERRYKMREEKRLVERQKVLAARIAETEQRKAREEIEKREKMEKLKKLEEMNKKKEEEMMKLKQEDERIAALIHQHNNCLQQKAVANSFLKKTVEQQKVSPPTSTMDKTYTLNDQPSNSKCDNYQITPPPKTIKKPPNPANYDITDIKSDDDTDDERKPRKPIPDWAKGQQFIQSLNEQFGKPRKYRDRVVAKIFAPVVLPVDLSEIFQGHRSVSSRYAKRTSSAVWDSPPLDPNDFSFLNSD